MPHQLSSHIPRFLPPLWVNGGGVSAKVFTNRPAKDLTFLKEGCPAILEISQKWLVDRCDSENRRKKRSDEIMK